MTTKAATAEGVFRHIEKAVSQEHDPDAVYYVSGAPNVNGQERRLLNENERLLALGKAERLRFESLFRDKAEHLLGAHFRDVQRGFRIFADYQGLAKKSLAKVSSDFARHFHVRVYGPLEQTAFTPSYLKRWAKALELTAHPAFTVLGIDNPYPDHLDDFVAPLLNTPWEDLQTFWVRFDSNVSRYPVAAARALESVLTRWKRTLQHISLEFPGPNYYTRRRAVPNRVEHTLDRYSRVARALVDTLLRHAPEHLCELTLWNWIDDDRLLTRLLDGLPKLSRLTFLSHGGAPHHLRILKGEAAAARLTHLRLGSWREHGRLDADYASECEALLPQLRERGLRHFRGLNPLLATGSRPRPFLPVSVCPASLSWDAA